MTQQVRVKYQFVGFTFCLEAYTLKRDDSEYCITLTQRSYDLLYVFCTHPEYVLSKDELMKAVWGRDVNESTVASAVSQLRKMLGDNAKRPTIIKTVPSTGYLFAVRVTGPDTDPDNSPPPIEINQRLDQLTVSVEFLLGLELQRMAGRARDDKQPTGFAMIEGLSIADQADTTFGLAQKAAQKFRGAEADKWLKFFDGQRDNLRVALDHYDGTSPRKALEIAISMTHFWDIRGHWTEGKERLGAALARYDGGDVELRAKGLGSYGFLLFNQNDRMAKEVLVEGAALSRQVEDDESLAFSLHSLALLAEAEGRYDHAENLFVQVLQVAKRANLGLMRVWALRGLGIVAQARSDAESARKWFSDSLTAREESGDSSGVATAQFYLAGVLDDQTEARRLIEKSLTSSSARNHRWSFASALHTRAIIEEAGGNRDDAMTAHQQSLLLCTDIQDVRGMARSKEGIARLTIISGDEKRGAQIYGEADALRFSISAPLAPDERKIHEALKLDVKKKFFGVYEDARLKPSQTSA